MSFLEHGCRVRPPDGGAAGRLSARQPHYRHHDAPARLGRTIADWVLALHAGRVKSLSRGVQRYEDNGARFLESSASPSSFASTRLIPKIYRPSPWPRRLACRRSRFSRRCSSPAAPTCTGCRDSRDAELDFKKLARAAGLRKAEMAPLKDVQPLTGYIRGGVTLFGARKPYPVYIDETVVLFDQISVSAGARARN